MDALDEAWDIFKREFDAARSQVARAARCQVTNELNQALRRLRNYQTESEWVWAVLDATSRFVAQAAVFAVQNEVLTLRGQQKLSLPEKLTFPVSAGRAFASAIESRDPVTALRAPAEVTEALKAPTAEERAHIFPIVNGDRVVAVLFAADQEYMDVNALEVITGIASAVLERRSNTMLHSQIVEPVQPAKHEHDTVRLAKHEDPPAQAMAKVATTEPAHNGAATAEASPKRSLPALPAWTDLSEEQRSLHIRAQRFSRVTVAEMQLARPDACRAGREQGNLYGFLKPEIDAARETYRQQFLTIPSMVDYLHLELVRTAAEGEELKLGAEYPGQLV